MKIALITNPGYFRDSLVALIRTLPGVKLECYCKYEDLDNMPFVNSPKLVIVDGDVEDWTLPSIRNVWPEARIITMLEKIDLHSEPCLLGTDGVFIKSLSAGEFISNIQWFLYDDYSATKQRIFHSAVMN